MCRPQLGDGPLEPSDGSAAARFKSRAHATVGYEYALDEGCHGDAAARSLAAGPTADLASVLPTSAMPGVPAVSGADADGEASAGGGFGTSGSVCA